MLSRLAFRGPLAYSRLQSYQVRLCTSQVAVKQNNENVFGGFKEDPERDLVNFPRRARPLYPGKVKLLCLPVEWFDALYNKTGVTGPYVFFGGLLTYLFSKEIWVIEHEFYSGCSLALALYIIIKKAGPAITSFLDKEMAAEDKELEDFRSDSVSAIKQSITNEEKSQWMAQGQSIMFEAKKENVNLQLEAEYRKRVMNAYNSVKQRLDYQVDVQIAKRRVEQQHMVKWITQNVMKSITPQQEKESLQKCFSDLKVLAA